MKQRFMAYMASHQMLLPGHKVLAAVSGGMDSMTMLHLLHESEIDCAVAHCNFQLRGTESDDDQLFVEKKAKEYGYPFHAIRFETGTYATENGLSVQMAARRLRYQWFEELSVEYDYGAIAVAHNRDDKIETLWINLSRGTGIRGLTGIRPKTGKIIRPLLFASRNEIAGYAKGNRIDFREDSSNATDKYARNYIRHHLIPGLEQYFPALRQTLEQDMDHFSKVEMFYNESINRLKQQAIRHEMELLYIDCSILKNSPSPETLLFEIVHPFGFSYAMVEKMLTGTCGGLFFSDTHRLVVDRQSFIVHPLNHKEQQTYLIDQGIRQIYFPIHLEMQIFDINPEYKPDTSRNVACLDFDRIEFPLELRKWKHGDKFRPLGMRCMKKLSDFFVDTKLSIIDKQQVWILASGNQIVWIVGHRIDDQYKISATTRKILKIQWV